MNDDQILHDLDERATSAVTDLKARAGARPAPAFDPDRPASVPVAPMPSRPLPSRRPLFAVAAAVVVAMLAAGLWIGTRGDDTDVADDLVTGSIQPYLPTVVPDGMELAGVGESDGTVDPEMSMADSVGALTTYGPAIDDPRIAVFASAELTFASGFESESSSDSGSATASEACIEQLEAGEDIDACPRSSGSSDSASFDDTGSSGSGGTDDASSDGPTSGAEPEEVAVGDRTGYLRTDGSFPGVLLEVPMGEGTDGPVINVLGRDDVDVDLLTAVAAATTVDGLAVSVASDGLPADWRLLDTDPDGIFLLSPMGALRGSLQNRFTTAYYVGAAPERWMVVTSLARPEASVHTQRLFLESAETVTVRGHEAIVGRFPAGGSDDGEGVTVEWEESWVVQWAERPGEIVSVSGFGLTRDELLSAAETLLPVDQTRWSELLEATALGDLTPLYPDDAPLVELGRGRFADGTAWVLRYSPERTDDDGTSAEMLDIEVALTGDSSSSSGGGSYSQVGTAVDEDGNPIGSPAEMFRSTSTLEKAGRAFAAGLVRGDVARVEVRSADGTPVEDAQMVSAEGQVAWVIELGAEGTTVVAFAADGTELGSHEIPTFGDGMVSHPEEGTIPAAGPTTTGG